MKNYTIEEIYQIAIAMEKNGEKFYRLAAESSSGEKLKALYLKLADDEKKHEEIFEGLSKQSHLYEPIEYYPEEYFSYVRSYADSVIFTEEQLKKLIYNTHNSLDALNFAIEREKDSIWYYSEIMSFIHEKQRDMIKDIIKEERKHFSELMEQKKNW